MNTTLRRAARWHRPLMLLVLSMGALTVVTAVGVVADSRVLTGAPIWLKPFKFSVSILLYGVTLAWMLSLLPRHSRVAGWAGLGVVVTLSVEMLVIVGQVVRGTTSHYNVSTPLNAALWQVMAVAILLLFIFHLIIAFVVLRQRIADRASAYAIRLGLGLALLGMLVAVPMTTPRKGTAGEVIAGAHSVDVPDGGPGLAVVGWSTTGGDLRIGHFVGLHGLQALPILAILMHRLLGRWLDDRTRARLLIVAGAAYGVLTLLLTWQALRGQPLLRPDALTLGSLVALVVATVTAGALVVVTRNRRSELELAA